MVLHFRHLCLASPPRTFPTMATQTCFLFVSAWAAFAAFARPSPLPPRPCSLSSSYAALSHLLLPLLLLLLDVSFYIFYALLFEEPSSFSTHAPAGYIIHTSCSNRARSPPAFALESRIAFSVLCRGASRCVYLTEELKLKFSRWRIRWIAFCLSWAGRTESSSGILIGSLKLLRVSRRRDS